MKNMDAAMAVEPAFARMTDGKALIMLRGHVFLKNKPKISQSNSRYSHFSCLLQILLKIVCNWSSYAKAEA